MGTRALWGTRRDCADDVAVSRKEDQQASVTYPAFMRGDSTRQVQTPINPKSREKQRYFIIYSS